VTKTTEPDNGLKKWLRGKKTYIAAAGVLVCGILKSQGIEVPIYVWAALTALGLSGIRSAIQNAK